MSSFQSFKSFVKIQHHNNTSPEKDFILEKKQNQEQLITNDPLMKNINQSQSESNQLKITKRSKKLGSICNFILKVFSMLEEKQISHIVSWSEKDTSLSSKNLSYDYKNQVRSQNNINSFQILDLQKFEEVVLPKYFKHSNMSSFVRQLNMYGFHKLRGDKGNIEFQHQKFNKNNKQMLSQIRRKNPQFGGMSSSHLEDNPQMSLRNLKSIEDRVSFLGENRPVTQQQLLSFREEYKNNDIFPSESFFPQKKISLEVQEQNQSQNSLEKEKNKKVQFIQEENNRLRKIKLSKTQRIKELSSFDKSYMQIKFSTVIFSFLALKLRQDLNSKVKKEFETKEKTKISNQNLNKLINHIMSNQQVGNFQFYEKNIQALLQEHTTQKQSQN